MEKTSAANQENVHITLGSFIHETLRTYYLKTVAYEAATLLDEDPEGLHQMRVNLRRLRTAHRIFAPYIELPRAARKKALRSVNYTLGALRDIDVLSEKLRECGRASTNKRNQAELFRTAERIAKERRTTFRSVERLLTSGGAYGMFRRDYSRWLRNPRLTDIAEQPLHSIASDVQLPLVKRLFRHPGWRIGIVTTGNTKHLRQRVTEHFMQTEFGPSHDMLHDLRKIIKRVRYQIQFFAPYYPAAYKKVIADFKSAQDTLGAIQDLFVLDDFLTDIFGNRWMKKFPDLAAGLKENQRESWKRWRPVHQKFTSRSFRSKLYGHIRQPLV